jgi:cytochrome P450
MFDRARNPLAPVLNRLPLPSNLRFLRALGEVERILDGFIENKRRALAAGEGAGDRPDLLTLLLRAQDVERGDAGGMSNEQLRDEAITLFAAGHETTANALVWTWYLLARNPGVEREMHAEIDRVVGDRPVEAGDVENLVYTRMVLAESMRLYPPAWVVAREAVGEVGVGGYRVPAGSVLLMSQYLLHRDGRYWEEPERFDPMRFTEEGKAGRPRYAYFPFGSGPRSCIGEGFAWVEGVVLIATVARRWRLELVGGQTVGLNPTITLRPSGEVRMRVAGRR